MNEMNEVYIVTQHWDYDDGDVVGVFADKEGAEKFVLSEYHDYKERDWSPSDDETRCWDNYGTTIVLKKWEVK